MNEKTIHTEEPSASGLASDEAFFSNVCACVAGMFERWYKRLNIEMITKDSEIAIAVKYDAVDFTNMGGIMGEGYQKLWAYLGKCGKEIAGAPYCKYTNGSADFMKFDIELGVPVSEPLPEQNGIYMSKTCEGRAIMAMHKGAYKEIENTYVPMMQYLAENKLESTGIYYDYYLNNPADTSESELLTKVVFPLR